MTGTMSLRFGLSAAVNLHMAKLTEKNDFVRWSKREEFYFLILQFCETIQELGFQ